jgi:hypothetical protein
MGYCRRVDAEQKKDCCQDVGCQDEGQEPVDAELQQERALELAFAEPVEPQLQVLLVQALELVFHQLAQQELRQLLELRQLS